MDSSFDQMAKSISRGVGWRKALWALIMLAFMALTALTQWAGVAQARAPRDHPGGGPPCDVVALLPSQAQAHIPPCVNSTVPGY